MAKCSSASLPPPPSNLPDWFRNVCSAPIISKKAPVQRFPQGSKKKKNKKNKKAVPFREERGEGVTEDSAVNVVSTLADACHVLILPPGSQAALN